MAKRVAEGVKAVWKAAKKDFADTPNTELFKQDVVDILDFARNKAALVTRSSDSNSKFLSAGGSGRANRAKPRVNQDVGAELLTHFKEEWMEIHCNTENASLVATKMDSDLHYLNVSVTKSHGLISKCREEFTYLQDIVEVLDEAQSKVNRIGELIQHVDQAICDYCQTKAELENERRKHSLQKQHDNVILESNNRMDQMKKVLHNELKLSVSLKHELESKELTERQEAFQEIFDKQMAEYRQKGEVDKPIDEVKTRRCMSQLDEVVIEDEDGTASLHEFLSDVVVDQPEILPSDEVDVGGIVTQSEAVASEV